MIDSVVMCGASVNTTQINTVSALNKAYWRVVLVLPRTSSCSRNIKPWSRAIGTASSIETHDRERRDRKLRISSAVLLYTGALLSAVIRMTIVLAVAHTVIASTLSQNFRLQKFAHSPVVSRSNGRKE